MKNIYQVEVIGTNRKYYIVAMSAEQAIASAGAYEFEYYQGSDHELEAVLINPDSYDAPTMLLRIEED